MNFLSAHDFYVEDDKLKFVFNYDIVVLFYSHECPYSQELRPKFHTIEQEIKGIEYGEIDVSIHPDIITLSQETTTPLAYVPLVAIFSNHNLKTICKDKSELRSLILSTEVKF